MQGNSAGRHSLFQDDMRLSLAPHSMGWPGLDNQNFEWFITHDVIKPYSANVSIP